MGRRSPRPVRPETVSERSRILRTITFHAMGTEVAVVAPAAVCREAGEAVRCLFETWEGTLSRFRPESELSRLNRAKGRRFVASPLLLLVLEAALAAARATGGVYDPGLGRSLKELGYDRTFEDAPRLGPPLARDLPAGGGWRGIQVERGSGVVGLPADVELDFGGIAKGMAVDAALGELERLGLTPALVNAGGDLAVRGRAPESSVWPVGVESSPGMVVPLRHGAIATSSVLKRRWQRGGEDVHHLVDPRSGRPATSGLRSVTVAAATCAQAEVAAKTALILGPEAGRRFLSSHHLAALWLNGETVETVGPFPAPQLRPVT